LLYKVSTGKSSMAVAKLFGEIGLVSEVIVLGLVVLLLKYQEISQQKATNNEKDVSLEK